jgi:hypothetical protein
LHPYDGDEEQHDALRCVLQAYRGKVGPTSASSLVGGVPITEGIGATLL